MELMYVNKLFNECYKLYKTYENDLKEDDFTEIARNCAEIANMYSSKGAGELAADMTSAIYAELGRMYRGK